MSTYPGDADGHDIDIDYEDCSDEPEIKEEGMKDQETRPPICLTKHEIAERLARDVARALKWRAICEEAAELPQNQS